MKNESLNLPFQNTYRGHTIDWDHAGNSVTIDGIEFVTFWHQTNIENPLTFAKFALDLAANVNNSFSA